MEKLESIFIQIKRTALDMAAPHIPEWGLWILAVLISIFALGVYGPLTMMYLTLLERKIIARMQNRPGPNRVGMFGLLQPLADGVKMFTKEDITPDQADKIVYFLAPILSVMPALLGFAVVPFGRGMIAVDLNVGLLYFLAVASMTSLTVFMASWGSRNKFSILGGFRAAAQIISYEVPMVLAAVPVLMITGSLSIQAIVEAQGGPHGLDWFVFTPWGLTGFAMFFLCGVAECNRSPFDLAEGESELVAGFHTEYSGIKFALFYMAEFMNAYLISAMTAALFLGGWQGPFLPSWLWMFLKTYALIFVMIWFRGTLPRFRVDQLMALAWKLLLPLALMNILVTGGWYYIEHPVLKNAGSAAALIFAFWILTRLNRPYLPEKRTYRFAE